MKFSIIIPTYDPGDRILNTIDSILRQTFMDYEIVIQDGSYSDEVETTIIEKYGKMNSIIIFHERDTGVYDAMNKAIDYATGLYCIFMGAGDILFDENVLTDIDSVISKNKFDIIYGNWVEKSDKGEIVVRRKMNWKYAVKFTPICHQAVFAKTELLKKYNFNTRYKIAADQEWLLRMKKKGKAIHYINRSISVFLLDGLSSQYNDVFLEEQRIIHGKYYPVWKTLRYTWRRMVGKEKA